MDGFSWYIVDQKISRIFLLPENSGGGKMWVMEVLAFRHILSYCTVYTFPIFKFFKQEKYTVNLYIYSARQMVSAW
jgi:hypothetical protein